VGKKYSWPKKDPTVSASHKKNKQNPIKNVQCFSPLEKSFDINYDALLGSAPSAIASPGCDCAVLPVCYRGEISRSAHAGASQCAMSPPWGQGWRKGGDHHLKRGFLQNKFFKKTAGKKYPARPLFCSRPASRTLPDAHADSLKPAGFKIP
jgi:hypothetical protein